MTSIGKGLCGPMLRRHVVSTRCTLIQAIYGQQCFTSTWGVSLRAGLNREEISILKTRAFPWRRCITRALG
jgi:hypothetical protein